MTGPSSDRSKYAVDKLLRDAELIAKRNPLFIGAIAGAYILAVIAIILGGYAAFIGRDSTIRDGNALTFASHLRATNQTNQRDPERHSIDTQTALMVQRTMDLEDKINATDGILMNLRDEKELMKRNIDILIREVLELKIQVSELRDLGNGTTPFSPQAKPPKSGGDSSSGLSFQPQKYIVNVALLVLLYICLAGRAN